MKEFNTSHIIGTLKVFDGLELVHEKQNKIKLDNFVRSLAFGAVHESVVGANAYRISTIRFGSGGEDTTGAEKLPDVTTNSLYVQEHEEAVNGAGNGIRVLDVEGDPTSKIIEVNCTISSEEANGIRFNELGLFDASSNKLTHICFDGLGKSENRTISFSYQLEIQVS